MSSDRISLRARWIIPVEGDPIANGTVEFENGVITAVHARHDLRAMDLGNVAIIPGLVNTHTHLEFSTLTEPLQPAEPFTAWIRALVGHRRSRGDAKSAIRLGLEELAAAGTTLCGQIATDDSLPADWPAASPRAVVFRELIALGTEKGTEQLAIAENHLRAWSEAVRGRTGPVAGLSPHAPYSVYPGLFRQLIGLAVQYQAPCTVHLAETLAELEFLRDGTGDWRTFYEMGGLWENHAMQFALSPLDFLREMEPVPHTIIAHGNYLTDEEIAFIAGRPQFSVAFCPRTHAFFGHRNHPWRKLRERGARVVLGTDSRASNPDLSLWREMQFLHRNSPDVDPGAILAMGTLHGAEALGLDGETGSLFPGKDADLAVIPLDGASSADPMRALFESRTGPVRAMRAGAWMTAN